MASNKRTKAMLPFRVTVGSAHEAILACFAEKVDADRYAVAYFRELVYRKRRTAVRVCDDVHDGVVTYYQSPNTVQLAQANEARHQAYEAGDREAIRAVDALLMRDPAFEEVTCA